MDIGKSISFVYEDKKWVEKVLIGGIVSLIPIVGQLLVTGYSLELVRNVRRGDPEPLPEWDNWGDKLVKGLLLTVIILIWLLPFLVLWVPGVIIMGVFSDTDFQGVASALWICASCVAALYGLVVGLLSPAITIFFAESGEFASGLKFREIWNFTRKHLGDVVIALLVLIVAGLAAGIVGGILCGIGVLFTTFIWYLVQGHLYGQIGRKHDGALVPAMPTKPIYDLSPNDIMPGVGEISGGAGKAADSALGQIQDLGQSAKDEFVSDVGEISGEVGKAADSAVDQVQDLSDGIKEVTDLGAPLPDEPTAQG